MQVIANIPSELPALPVVAELSFDDAIEALAASDQFCEYAWFLFDLNDAGVEHALA